MSCRQDPKKQEGCNPLQEQLDRRQFLFGAGAAVVWLALPGAGGRQVQAQRADYPREKIGKLSDLEPGRPIEFRYPWDHPNAENTLLQLDEPAAGGVGPQKNIVAFNNLCTHQGRSMSGTFKGEIGVAGPCPLHWTTFDLTRRGMVVSGHATIGLPQIVLETDGDDIHAVGVLGLIFGCHDNRVNPETI